MKKKNDVYSVLVEAEVKGSTTKITVAFPPKQKKLSVANTANVLAGGIALLIRSCSKGETGIKDYELLDNIIKYLTHEFVEVKSFDDAKLNPKDFK